MTHDLYKNGDPDAPDVIKDRHGEVVLSQCRRCGRAEIELSLPCFRVTPALPAPLMPFTAADAEWAAKHLNEGEAGHYGGPGPEPVEPQEVRLMAGLRAAGIVLEAHDAPNLADAVWEAAEYLAKG